MKSISALEYGQQLKERADSAPSTLAEKILEAANPVSEFILKSGSVIISEKAYDKTLYYLKEGKVEFLQESPDGVHRIKSIYPGGLFGLSAYPKGGFNFASAVTLGRSVVIKYACSDVKKFVEKDSELSAAFKEECKRERLDILLAKSGLFAGLKKGDRNRFHDKAEIFDFKRGAEMQFGTDDHIFILFGQVAVKWREGTVEKQVLMFENDLWWGRLLDISNPALISHTDCIAVKISSRVVSDLFYGKTSFGQELKSRVFALRSRIEEIRKNFVVQKKLDFMISSGLSYAKAPPVIDLSQCIKCRSCEEACRKRHGVKRLDIDKAIKLDVFSFPNACHKCEIPMCVSKCAKGAMQRQSDGEVTVDLDLCKGCGACAKGCPFDSISIIPEDALLYGDVVSRTNEGGPAAKESKRVPRLASKCDHCSGYCDQACVRECPTGAISRIIPIEY